MVPTLSERWAAFQAGLDEVYAGPYRRTFARAQQEEDDLFLLVVLAEALGVPDPAAYYTAELMPAAYPQFHAWHLRMGLDRTPLEHIRCC
ncbi:cory-CC-star protein [Demetria terragena]|uniref:cory-CC-star protein n=1 Tax=Demetria terragena TaxID=63959 RepID=UPI00037095CB|nr:cory-CC-star protein [Demetria terragena]